MADSIYYVAVGRDDAKQLFGTKEPTALRTLVTGWIESLGTDFVLTATGAWADLKGLLTAPSEETQLAVTSLFEGNRQLSTDAEFSVAVVRPDAVGAVAHFLSEADSVGNESAQALQASLKNFFVTAVEQRQAIAIVRSSNVVGE